MSDNSEQAIKSIGTLKPDAQPEEIDQRAELKHGNIGLRMDRYRRRLQATGRYSPERINFFVNRAKSNLENEFMISNKALDDSLDSKYMIASRLVHEEGLEPEEAIEAAGEFLEKRKARKEIYQEGDVSLGLELEILNANDDQIKAIDASQDLGFLVGLDGKREFITPPSFGYVDQARVIYEMERLGIVTPETLIKMHINIGGFQEPTKHLKDIFLLNTLFTLSGLFGLHEDADVDKEGSIEFTDASSNKSLLEGQGVSVIKNIPIRVRKNGVVELRKLFYKWTSSLDLVEGLADLTAVSQSLKAFTNRNSSEAKEKTEDESQIWLELKEKLIVLIDDVSNQVNTKPPLNTLIDYFETIEQVIEVNKNFQTYLQTTKDEREEWQEANLDQDFFTSVLWDEHQARKAELDADIFMLLYKDPEAFAKLITSRYSDRDQDAYSSLINSLEQNNREDLVRLLNDKSFPNKLKILTLSDYTTMVTTRFGQYQWVIAGLAKKDNIRNQTRSMIVNARGEIVRRQKQLRER